METNNSKKGKRQLKIYPKYIQRKSIIVIVPEIRLQGKWLKEYGFNHGQSVMIVCEEEQIIITLNKLP